MKTNPKTEQQLNEENLAPDGEYYFKVARAQDEVSKSGNEMIHLGVAIYQGEKERWRVDDYLLEKLAWKLRSFCAATGLLARYESGQLAAADCLGVGGKCVLGVKEAEGDFPAKNVIKKYVVKKGVEAKAAAKPATQPEPAATSETDDIPF